MEIYLLGLKVQYKPKFKLPLDIHRGAGRSIIGGGAIFIYSCSAQHEYMNIAPPPNYRSSAAPATTHEAGVESLLTTE